MNELRRATIADLGAVTALQRAAYDIGYKGELIGVLEAEVTALRDGRLADAEALRRAREAAVAPVEAAGPTADGPLVEDDVVPPDDLPGESGSKESAPVERR